MKNDIENSKGDVRPTNRKRTRDHSDDEESCDETEDSADSNQDKGSKSPVVRGKRRRIDNKSLHDTNWEKTFQRLVAYKEIHNHTMVPSHYDEDPPLGLWVSRQRYQYRNDELPSNRLDLLNSIDFAWNLYDKTWRRMFKKLVVYKEKHKNTMVPSQYDEDPKFGKWVSQQRGIYKNDDMPSNRLDLLNSIDFEWEGVQGKKYEKWDDVFQKLVAYNKLHKHTMVPKPYDEDPPLGRWVSTQRKVFNKNKLLKERLDKLNSIGFVWRVLR
ncbi:hypothetical protein FRACYDRAFT_201645 [Fragilariopsis cylindrus CCMP1102]|uniref:Helicase-associated domain-containing protein n=1 Tax=Fragilariopsis cylindrus CCMP1102 TaxID=635003 RepID=A0A1E7EL34_9STRA|nr:hypothetical protein FRACYDRAFT_201645 [Fragilariopsis cylindrus CCMP1102]|eukprot:OEU06263.1 hypothetical protein FRACYDRAFT_201645 [Fragilariopsis cylindrus CCMP1102]